MSFKKNLYNHIFEKIFLKTMSLQKILLKMKNRFLKKMSS